MRIVIGNAWPYTNGKLHLGRIVVLLPGDIIARYHRKKGDKVIFVSGSDTHGNLVLEKAHEEGLKPLEIIDKYHKEFKKCFNSLDFSFDLFSNTDSKNHKEWVKDKILELYNKGYIYEDFTDNDKNLMFKLSSLNYEVESIFKNGEYWRENAKKITEKYISEGLRDKAVTKDIKFGVDVPLDGYEDKKIFVWIEALMGYLTATQECIDDKEETLEDYFNSEDSRVYLVHGKDNIPFHSIIFTGILSALGYKNVKLRIFSSNHLKLEGKNFSTIKNWALWINDVLEKYSVDLIRYYLITNSPEKSDSDFRFRNFINANNYELVEILERFYINTISLYKKGKCNIYKNKYEKDKIINYYEEIGEKIERGELKSALKNIISLVKEFNEERNYSIIKLINIANLLEPFMPTFSEKIKKLFEIKESGWNFIHVENIPDKLEYIETFKTLDKNLANEEIRLLKIKKNKVKNLEYLQ